MFSSMPTTFSALKTATKPNLENQPPYAAVFVWAKPQHMVVFLTLEIVFISQDMKNSDLGGFICLFRFVRCRRTTRLGAVRR